MREFVRGEVIQFYDWQFRDRDKELTVPESAQIRIRYQKCGCDKFDEVPLQVSGAEWSAQWDSSEADPGTIYYFVESISPKVAVAEGEFRLKANPANPRG